jgi:hypothetical protein
MRRPTTSDIRGALRGAMNTTEREALQRARIGKIVPGGMITDVPNMPGRVYIRLYRNGSVSLTTAINRGAPLRANSENDLENDVWVKIDPKTASYVIERRTEIVDTDQPQTPLTVPRHRHNIGSGNEDPVEGLRFLPGLVHKRAQDSLVVKVREFTYKTATGYAKFATTTFDLTPYLPATVNKHAYVIVGFNPATEAIVAVTGTEYPTTTTLTTAHIEEITFPYVPLAAVKLKNGQTRSPDYRDFVDLREWFSSTIPIIYAPTSAKYWVSEASGDLSAEVNLGALTTGVVYITVAGGIATPSTATQSELATALLGANGGANQVVKRATTTGALSVGALVTGDIPTTMTGKTLSGGSLTGETVTDFLQITENGGAISNPANTAVKLFASDGNSRSYVQFLDSTGLVTVLGETVKVLARNESGSTITKGKIVRVSGVGSALPLITLAIADTVANAEGILAVVMEDTANNANGHVMLHGRITIDTSALATGDAYVSGSSAGNIVTSAPTIARKIGVILSAALNGLVYFSPQPVSVSTPTAIGAAPASGPKYVVAQATSDLANEVDLGALASGLLKHAVAGGVSTPATAVVSTDYVAPNTGTNVVNDGMVSTLTTTKLRGTLGRIPLLQGAGSAAVELAGSNTGDLLRWNGGTWGAYRPGFGEVISQAQLGSDVASISLSSLSAINGDFDHLLLTLRLRTSRAATLDGLVIRFNGDTTAANYQTLQLHHNHPNGYSTSELLPGAAAGAVLQSGLPGSLAAAFEYALIEIFIPDYKVFIYKNVMFRSYFRHGTSSGQIVAQSGGFTWFAGNAITSITLTPQVGPNFLTGGVYSLNGAGSA